MVLRSLSILEDTAAASRAEFTMQQGARAIIGFMDCGLRCGFFTVREGLGRNFCGKAKRCAKESLPVETSTLHTR